MKTMTKVVAVALVAVIMCMMLASCGNTISGTYSGKGSGLLSGVSYSYEFKGKNFKVTYSGSVGGMGGSLDPQEGTYEITKADDGSLQIAFTIEEDGKTVTSDPVSYVKGDGYIEIDGIKLTKKDK